MSAPYEGDSTATNLAGITGRNTSTGGNGIGVLGTSASGEGVHGETNSTTFAAVAGIELNAASNIAAVYGEQRGGGPAVFGTAAKGEGVHGETKSSVLAAVTGLSLNKSATGGAGVWGHAESVEGVHGETNSTAFAAVSGIELNPASNIAAVYGEQRGNGPAVFGIAKGNGGGVFGTSANGEGVHGETNSTVFAAVAGITLNPSGTGAGVYGESRGKGPAGFFKGNVVVTGDVILSNADCAEDFDMAMPEDATPGTVMALDAEGRLRPTSEAYDKKVVGVISGAGNYKPGIVLDRTSRNPERMPVALLGKVYTQVDARFGSIQAGDLLTSSPTPGYAMRASDPTRAFGSVIGKALACLSSGQGLIPVLISLQ